MTHYAVPFPKLSAFAWISIVLLLLGGLATFWTVFGWTEAGYVVNVAAPDDLAWTLWIPQPDRSMPLTTQGSVAVIGTVETAYRPLLTVTGTGGARIRYSTGGIALAADWPPPHVNLTGREGQWPNGTYRIWRHSSDPAANLTLTSNLPSRATGLDGSWECGGSAFVGYPQEGWNAMPIAFGDCLGLVLFPPGTIPATLLIPGTALAAVAWRRQRATHS